MFDLLPWIGFIGFILLMLAIDLGVFHRKPHAITAFEAGIWTSIWVGLALVFNVFVYFWKGPSSALEFLTGYVVEKSLSVDNIFVFIMIFSYFSVPAKYQHRVLFWGILGAIIMRAAFIFLGVKLISHFQFVFYIFGFFLLYTAFKMFKERHSHGNISENRLLDWVSRTIPLTKEYVGQNFFVRRNGRLYATPMFMVLLAIEFSDVIFAVDSIPAIFAITQDTFIIFTSNIFAILGLRSMYFLLADIVPRFYYLKHALSFILGFIGVKMMIFEFAHIPVWVSLSVILASFSLAIVFSIFHRDPKPKA